MAIHLEFRDRVAWMTLARPDTMNSFDEVQIGAFAGAVGELAGRDDVNAVVVTGAGLGFSVGLDLELLGRGFADSTYFMAQLDRFGEALTAFERLPVPTIAAVNGFARAGGFELLLCCDLVVVADDARVGDTHAIAGLPPGGGASARLPRRIARQRATDLLFTGRWLVGQEVVDIGLASKAVPGPRLLDEAAQLAAQFASLSRSALVAIKSLLREGATMSLDEALALELERFEEFLRHVPSASEGYTAFVEGRDPDWETG